MEKYSQAVRDCRIAKYWGMIQTVQLAEVRVGESLLFDLGNLIHCSYGYRLTPFSCAIFIGADKIVIVSWSIKNIRYPVTSYKYREVIKLDCAPMSSYLF